MSITLFSFILFHCMLTTYGTPPVGLLRPEDGSEFGSDTGLRSGTNPFMALSKLTHSQHSFFGIHGHYYVTYHGVIGFFKNENSIRTFLNNCPEIPNKDGGNNFIAVFWREFTDGTVHHFSMDKNRARAQTLLNSSLFEFTSSPVKKVDVFTWNRMFSRNDYNGEDIRHTFQAALITTKNHESFVRIHYETVPTEGANSINGSTQECRSASVGIKVLGCGSNNNEVCKASWNFKDFFKYSDGVECFTNQPTESSFYRNIGSYTLQLHHKEKPQTSPENPPCFLDEHDASRCLIKTNAEEEINNKGPRTSFSVKFGKNWRSGARGESGPTASAPTTTMTKTPKPHINLFQIIADKYCSSREPGWYRIPIYCRAFIMCTTGKRAFVKLCPKGTVFNPRFFNCDHNVNYECDFLMSSGVNKALPTLSTVPTSPSIHNNTCEYLGYGEYPDPLSCTHYYACTNARSIRMPCPAGLFFKIKNETSGHCEFPKKVNCRGNGDRTATTPLPYTTKTRYHH